MLTVLPGVLKGYRNQTYRNIFKLHRQGLVKTDPDKVYTEVKQRLLHFRETIPEKQARVMQEFDMLTKGNLPAAAVGACSVRTPVSRAHQDPYRGLYEVCRKVG